MLDVPSAKLLLGKKAGNDAPWRTLSNLHKRERLSKNNVQKLVEKLTAFAKRQGVIRRST
jgi:hypothetical protein